MDMNLSKLREIVKVREAWSATVHGVAKSRTRRIDWTTSLWSDQSPGPKREPVDTHSAQSRQLVSILSGPPGPTGEGEGLRRADTGGVQGTSDAWNSSSNGATVGSSVRTWWGHLLIKLCGSERDWSGISNPHCTARSMDSSPSICWATTVCRPCAGSWVRVEDQIGPAPSLMGDKWRPRYPLTRLPELCGHSWGGH